MMFARVFLFAFGILAMPVSAPNYKSEIEQWRHNREARLKADDGWLTVSGLFWLKEGGNTVGAGKSNRFVLPSGSAPDSVGVFEFKNGHISFNANPGVTILLNGRPATTATLKPDSSASPDVLQINALTMFVIQRGDKVGIRLKDKNSPMRRAFTGIKYFPPDERYRVRAKFVPYDPPKVLSIPNILGQTDHEASPGYVEFTLNGHACRLDPVTEGNTLFFIFKDLTSGRETYPPGRFLNTPMPANGEVTLDFNKAYNPPCAFTPYATCPLPPPQNILPIRIEAGELRYGH